jgi:peptide/nickel transport system substrate-binding protein
MKKPRKSLFGWWLAVGLTLILGGGAFTTEAKTLNMGLSGNPDSLDPHRTAGTLTFQTAKSLYDTLAEPDMSGKIVAALAESWEVSPDGLTWKFTLRKGVVFHNGEKMTSKDVKATLDRVMNKATAAPKASEFQAIVAIETPDDLSVVLKLKEPAVPLLATLASGWSAILPKSLIEANHDFATKPVGTGPFKLKEWVRDNRIVLQKNPNYWIKDLPKLDEVVINIIPERAVQVQGLISGQLQANDMVDKDDVPTLEKSKDVKVDKALTAQILVLSINCNHPLLKDVRVRQAVSHAIDKQKVLDVVYGGGKPVGTFMDYSNPYYKDLTSLYPYDPEKAKKLLAEAGVGADKPFEITVPQNYELHVKAGEMYQDMLRKAGMNVRIKLVDWSTWLGDVYKASKFDFTVIGHTGKLDPDGTLDGYGTDKRYVKWINPRAAELIEQGRKVSGFDARKKIYDEALELMAKEVPFMYLGTSYRYTGYRSNVSEFRVTPSLDSFDFRWTDMK